LNAPFIHVFECLLILTTWHGLWRKADEFFYQSYIRKIPAFCSSAYFEKIEACLLANFLVLDLGPTP